MIRQQVKQIAIFALTSTSIVTGGWQQAHALEHATKLQLSTKVSTYTIKGELDYRYTNTSDLYYRHYALELATDISDNWRMSGGYRNAYKLASSQQWILEQRPYLQIQQGFSLQPIKWWWRSRLEYRMRESKDDVWRYRLRLLLKSRSYLWGIRPFISNEFFYALDKHQYNKNWLAVGLDFHSSSWGKPSIYYKYIADLNDNNWDFSYSLVFKLAYKI